MVSTVTPPSQKSPEQRQKRRSRRVRRTLRRVVPFFSLPLLCGVLVFMVDIITYHPVEESPSPHVAKATPTPEPLAIDDDADFGLMLDSTPGVPVPYALPAVYTTIPPLDDEPFTEPRPADRVPLQVR